MSLFSKLTNNLKEAWDRSVQESLKEQARKNKVIFEAREEDRARRIAENPYQYLMDGLEERIYSNGWITDTHNRATMELAKLFTESDFEALGGNLNISIQSIIKHTYNKQRVQPSQRTGDVFQARTALSELLQATEWHQGLMDITALTRGNKKVDSIIINLEANKLLDEAFAILIKHHNDNPRYYV